MNKGGYLIFGLLLFGVFVALAHSAVTKLIDKVEFVRASITKPKFEINAVYHTITLTYQSFLPTAVRLDGFVGVLFYGNNRLADLLVSQPVIFQPNSITEIAIQATIRYTEIAASIIDAIKSEHYLQDLSIRGDMKTQGLSIPVRYPLSLI